MRPYEILFIIKTDREEEEFDAVIEKFTALIEREGDQVSKVDKWGKRKLAYEIDKKYRDGFYTLINFEGEPGVASELDRVMRISEEILRHMITKLEQ